MEEIWKDINGYEGCYMISSLGKMQSVERCVNHAGGSRLVSQKSMKLTPSNTGYFVVTLWKNNISKVHLVHRLVAETFIPNPNNLPEVNHKDGNKLNNCVDNLEWVTQRDNNIHAIQTGLRDAYKQIGQYDLNGNFIKSWNSIKEAQTFYETSHISECCQGKRNKTKGFIWKYLDN